jgi:hypothetical protein
MYKDKPVSAKQEIDSGIGIGEILLVRFLKLNFKNVPYQLIYFTLTDFVFDHGRPYRRYSRANEDRIPI